MSADDVDELREHRTGRPDHAALLRSDGGAATPTLVVARDVGVDAVLDERERLHERGLPAPSLRAVVVKACALALREHPRVNASWRGGAVVEHARIHVGVTVAAPDTVRAPVLRDADRMSLLALSWVLDELSRQVRAGQLPASAARGATFTVANLGALGVEAPASLLTPPQAAMLTVEALPVDAGPGPALAVRLRLTGDRRVLSAFDAERFLASVAGAVEVPLALAS